MHYDNIQKRVNSLNNKDRFFVYRLIYAFIDMVTGNYRLFVVLKLEI